MSRTDLVVSAGDSKAELRRELDCADLGARELRPGLYGYEAPDDMFLPPRLVFARQLLPDARPIQADSIRLMAEQVVASTIGVVPEDRPWSLHVFPLKEVEDTRRLGARAWHTAAHAKQPGPKPEHVRPTQAAGQNRCRLIRESVMELLAKRRRHLLKRLRREAAPFVEDESLAQLLLTAPEQGHFAISLAPTLYELRHRVSHLPGGELAPSVDKRPPSRAFSKLLEAEVRLGRRIQAGETCVDLGASPGSWTFVAAERGARVLSVDRSQLRADLMHDPRVEFRHGDAFRFEPERPVDWLLCDVIAAAERSAELLLRWLERGLCRYFVVTLKLDDAGSPGALEQLAQRLPALSREYWLLRLCANKKEVCAFGLAKSGSAQPPRD